MSQDEGKPSPAVFAELVRIALPSVAATTSYSLMQFADKLMVSKIGPDPIYVGAQGSGGMAAWIPVSFMWGAIAVINTFAAQNLGAGTPRNAPRYAWNAMWFAVIAWLAMLIYGFFLPDIFRLMGYEPRRVQLACDYGQIMVAGAILTMGARGIGQFFYGIHRPRVVMVASITGNLVNLGLNWLLIYGNWGFPRLELKGAAIATIVGAGVEAAIPFAIFLGPTMNRLYETRHSWRPDVSCIKEIWRLGWPAGAMFGNEMICWGFFMLYLVGSFGTQESTAGFIAHQWMSLSFMPAVGISNAVTATVGRYIGMKRPDLAARSTSAALRLALGYMGLCGLCFVLFGKQMTGFFIPSDTPPEAREHVLDLGAQFLIACAAFQLFDAIAMTLSGALRGAGDTHWVGVVTVIMAWTIIVGGGLLVVRLFPGLGSLGPWITSATYIIVLALAILARYLGGKWKTMTVVESPAA
ncbi:MAG: MATE family efflux transporter [Planctomycetes bacterium]|nr:MATE family efflux transporter [Planctomycetota bacterium]